jgi:hypothetical protein
MTSVVWVDLIVAELAETVGGTAGGGGVGALPPAGALTVVIVTPRETGSSASPDPPA